MSLPFRPAPKSVLTGLALALALVAIDFGAAMAETLTGKIEAVGADTITLAGRAIALSPARTNICVGGICDQGKDKLRVGMTCAAELAQYQGKAEARRLSCR